MNKQGPPAFKRSLSGGSSTGSGSVNNNNNTSKTKNTSTSGSSSSGSSSKGNTGITCTNKQASSHSQYYGSRSTNVDYTRQFALTRNDNPTANMNYATTSQFDLQNHRQSNRTSNSSSLTSRSQTSTNFVSRSRNSSNSLSTLKK